MRRGKASGKLAMAQYVQWLTVTTTQEQQLEYIFSHYQNKTIFDTFEQICISMGVSVMKAFDHAVINNCMLAFIIKF